MIEKRLDVTNTLGLHARAAAKVVSVASRYTCRIHVINGDQALDAKSIMALLTLGAAKGSTITFRVDGNDEVAAMEELSALFERRFDEEE